MNRRQLLRVAPLAADVSRFARENGIKGVWLAGPDLNLEIYEIK